MLVGRQSARGNPTTLPQSRNVFPSSLVDSRAKCTRFGTANGYTAMLNLCTNNKQRPLAPPHSFCSSTKKYHNKRVKCAARPHGRQNCTQSIVAFHQTTTGTTGRPPGHTVAGCKLTSESPPAATSSAAAFASRGAGPTRLQAPPRSNPPRNKKNKKKKTVPPRTGTKNAPKKVDAKLRGRMNIHQNEKLTGSDEKIFKKIVPPFRERQTSEKGRASS